MPIDFLFIVVTALHLWGENPIDTKHQPNIYIKNDLLIYDADTSIANVNKAITLLAGSKVPVKTVVVTSNGGDIEGGMNLGEYIYNHHMNVIVEGICASSCANYIFTAAKQKIVEDRGLVAWHGGALQRKWNTPWYYEFIPDYKKDFKKKLIALRQREQLFFRKIGVKEEITVIGQWEQFFYQRKGKPLWTLTTDEMRYFGVEHVFFKGKHSAANIVATLSFTREQLANALQRNRHESSGSTVHKMTKK